MEKIRTRRNRTTRRQIQIHLRRPGDGSLLALDARDMVISIIRRTEVLARLLEAAAESGFDLDAETHSEAAHMIRDEMENLRRVLQISRPSASQD